MSKDVDSLRVVVDELGLGDSDLGDIVLDAKEQEAAEINKAGLTEQLEFLANFYGSATEAEAIIRTFHREISTVEEAYEAPPEDLPYPQA